jgi:hypothetical protein
MLYFFHGQGTVVLSHGITKQHGTVPHQEIARVIECKAKFTKDPNLHRYEETA